MKFHVLAFSPVVFFAFYFLLPACLGNPVSCFVLLLPFSFPRLQLCLCAKYILEAYGTNQGL